MRIDRAAFPFVAALGGLAMLGGAVSLWAAVPAVVLLVFAVWFFRDPERHSPGEPSLLLSPADGRIIQAGAGRISVFMNVFDVHVCRSPLAGKIVEVSHHAGDFLAAFRDEASEHNERTSLVVDSVRCRVRFTLVAGLIARRIVCRVCEGQSVVAGERIGLIRFGSRVDVDLPEGARVQVKVGDRVVAGVTVLARMAPTARA